MQRAAVSFEPMGQGGGGSERGGTVTAAWAFRSPGVGQQDCNDSRVYAYVKQIPLCSPIRILFQFDVAYASPFDPPVFHYF